MGQYKRNQVEEAISRTLGEKSATPSRELRTRLKRLLDADRALTIAARKAKSKVTNYAFYSSDSPGKGSEVSFSDYEAFALQTSLRVLDHAWPQSFAVNALRHIRSELESEHSRILKQDPGKLFGKERIKRQVRPGDLGVGNTDPVFLTLVSGQTVLSDGIADQTSAKVCRGMERVSKFIQENNAHSWTLFELVNQAHDLEKQLAAVRPRSRGRS
jgi:hypothetical protein